MGRAAGRVVSSPGLSGVTGSVGSVWDGLPVGSPGLADDEGSGEVGVTVGSLLGEGEEPPSPEREPVTASVVPWPLSNTTAIHPREPCSS